MRKAFKIPGDLAITAVIGFGYPRKKVVGRKDRLPLEQVAFSELYGNKLRKLE